MTTRSQRLISPPAVRPGHAWRAAGTEPALSEVLADPIVHTLMHRDGVSRDQLAAVIAAAQSKLRRCLCGRLAA